MCLDFCALTEAVDRYAAAHGTGDKPRAFAVGQTYSKLSGMFFTPSKPLSPRTSVSAVMRGGVVVMQAPLAAVSTVGPLTIYEPRVQVSMLKYIDVCITSDDSSVTKYTNALCDSGAEICVIKSS